MDLGITIGNPGVFLVNLYPNSSKPICVQWVWITHILEYRLSGVHRVPYPHIGLVINGDAQSSVMLWLCDVISHDLMHHKCWNITFSQWLDHFQGLYCPRVIPYGLHGVHRQFHGLHMEWHLTEAPAILSFHRNPIFHMEWLWNGYGMVNSMWTPTPLHMDSTWHPYGLVLD